MKVSFRPLAVLMIAASAAICQTWQPLTRQPTFNPGAMLLLTDGTVLVHSEPNSTTTTSTDYSSWYQLTPDADGSYVNGTWTQVASLPAGYAPLYFGSAVLPDGRVVVEGGEYDCSTGTCNAAWTNQGAIYDSKTNKWTSVAPPKGWTTIGDAQSVVLANGTYMQANCCTKQAALLNPNNLTWTVTGAGKFDINDEEEWNLLPNGKVLTTDAYVFQYGTNSEIYDPATATWTSAGSTIAQLWDSCGGADAASYEVGPAVLRPDGMVFATGGNTCGPGHTSIYNSRAGTWTAGPDFPGAYNADDAPAALEPNGNVLWCSPVPAVSIRLPGSFSNMTAPAWRPLLRRRVPFWTPRMSGICWYYQPDRYFSLTSARMLRSIRRRAPTTQNGRRQSPSVPGAVSRGKTYTVAGTQFNGLSQGGSYGDDFQDATNFPLVRLVNAATGHVFYCRTHNHSTMAVATGNKRVSTQFDVPANADKGLSQLFVVANGIHSSPVWIKVQ
jgi:hypothetical protein